MLLNRFRFLPALLRLILIVLLGTLAIALTAQFAGGQGTADDPWQISRPEDIDNIRNYLGAAHRNKYYLQTNDINLGVPPWNEGEGWISIGTAHPNTITFQGNYDGNGYVIDGLFINRHYPYYLGLFGCVEGGVIQNVGLTNVNFNGQQYAGPLVGQLRDNAVVRNCYSTGNVTGDVAVGGLVGYGWRNSIIENSYSTCTVVGIGEARLVGGLVGYYWTGNIRNSYARGSISGNEMIGGLVGYLRNADVENCYSTGRVATTPNAGGLVGIAVDNPRVTESYWDIQTSEQNASAGGEGRQTAQMIYPYEPNTYVRWDFEEIWVNDVNRRVNNGYPFLFYNIGEPSPHPDIAANPSPQNEAVNVPITLERVGWTYTENNLFTNPLGFRVYMNTIGEFGEDDHFDWVPYVAEQENYSSTAIVPEEIQYFTTYYWMVVPTTIDPNGGRRWENDNKGAYDTERLTREDNNPRSILTPAKQRGDAENVPVWQFTAQLNPHPTIATNPTPEDGAFDVYVNLEQLGWTFIIDNNYTNPVGFRIYFNTTGEFGEEDEFHWVNFTQQQTIYTTAAPLPDELEYATLYYWKVVPTTQYPDNRGFQQRFENEEGSLRRYTGSRTTCLLNREDAENVPVWSFTTLLINPNPQPAVNPQPEHLSEGISLGLDRVTWDYETSLINAYPVGFRVYMNTTGAFGSNAPFIWVDYVEEQITYSCFEIIPFKLDPSTTYYWRVIPTTIYPDEDLAGYRYEERGDAQNCPIWRFTTGTTGIDDESQFITKLLGNYPNPFNPHTAISFSLAEADKVTLTIFNSRGQKIITLIDQYITAGEHQVMWNGRDEQDILQSTGVYYYRIEFRQQSTDTLTGRMIMIK